MFNVIRAEVRKFNIKVTNIMPGATDTPMWSSASRQKYQHRMMTPKEIADITIMAANQPKKVVIEDIIIKPIKGDL